MKYSGALALLASALLAAPVAAENAGKGLPNAHSARESMFRSADDLSLGRLTLSSEALSMVSNTEWRSFLESGGLSVSREGESGREYRATMDSVNLDLPPAQQAKLREAGLPDRLDRAVLNAKLSFLKPVTPRGMRDSLVSQIDVDSIVLDLGNVRVDGSGKLERDKFGKMNGSLSVRVDNWREVAELPAISRALKGRDAEAMLDGITNGNVLEVDLRVRDGKLMLGPLELTSIPPIFEGF
jgi:hypothetical protein